MSDRRSFFATAPKGMETFLVDELKSLGALEVKEKRAGVSFSGQLETAYRACLWSRIANRILLPIAEFAAETPEELYEGVRGIYWEDHLQKNGTLAVDFNSVNSKIRHSKYGALKVKDGIADYFRDKTGIRPSVNLDTPDIRVNVFLFNNKATVYIDLSGESLHRRGYRVEGGIAPLKENLAAAVLIKSGWPEIAKAGGTLIDPMCGSGTLAFEAALIAADSAPGLLRPYFGFLKWEGSQPQIWRDLLEEAEERESRGFERIPLIIGYDSESGSIKNAFRNLEKIGLSGMIHFEKRQLGECLPTAKTSSQPGLVIANPPYGERLGDLRQLKPLYSALGNQLRQHFEGWKAAVLTGNPDLGKSMGIRAVEKRGFFNGAIQCQLLRFEVDPRWYVKREHALFQRPGAPQINPQINSLAEPFANRIRKNQKKLKSWIKKEGISAYRVYDRDLPEFAAAVDIYDQWLHVQEYEAPKTVDPRKAEERLAALLDALPVVLDLPPENIFLKVRRKQKGNWQYEKLASEQKFYQVSEEGCQFLVNFTDYLDTGLFLDHRLIRKMIRESASGKRFLNLFSHTGSATVHAAKGGAKSTVSVDMSSRYSEWARQNMAINGFSSVGADMFKQRVVDRQFYKSKHRFVTADCLRWLEREKDKYDLIFLDPPTFSNSKKMSGVFDIQKDHARLIRKVLTLLSGDGVLLFSTNFRKFKPDLESLSDLHMENLTAAAMPPDFQKTSKIHKCWKISRR